MCNSYHFVTFILLSRLFFIPDSASGGELNLLSEIITEGVPRYGALVKSGNAQMPNEKATAYYGNSIEGLSVSNAVNGNLLWRNNQNYQSDSKLSGGTASPVLATIGKRTIGGALKLVVDVYNAKLSNPLVSSVVLPPTINPGNNFYDVLVADSGRKIIAILTDTMGGFVISAYTINYGENTYKTITQIQGIGSTFTEASIKGSKLLVRGANGANLYNIHSSTGVLELHGWVPFFTTCFSVDFTPDGQILVVSGYEKIQVYRYLGVSGSQFSLVQNLTAAQGIGGLWVQKIAVSSNWQNNGLITATSNLQGSTTLKFSVYSMNATSLQLNSIFSKTWVNTANTFQLYAKDLIITPNNERVFMISSGDGIPNATEGSVPELVVYERAGNSLITKQFDGTPQAMVIDSRLGFLAIFAKLVHDNTFAGGGLVKVYHYGD